MNWNEVFKEYKNIKLDNAKIDSFCDVNGNWLVELKYVFLHNTESEMFIVLDLKENLENLFRIYDIEYETEDEQCIKYNLYRNFLKKVISKWENLILNFINFEWDNEIKRKYIKYNISLIILCSKESIIKDEVLNQKNTIIKEERSTNICRKIFIFDEDSEQNYLPFYFENINNNFNIRSAIIEKELEKKLKEVKEYLEELSESEGEKDNDTN